MLLVYIDSQPFHSTVFNRKTRNIWWDSMGNEETTDKQSTISIQDSPYKEGRLNWASVAFATFQFHCFQIRGKILIFFRRILHSNSLTTNSNFQMLPLLITLLVSLTPSTAVSMAELEAQFGSYKHIVDITKAQGIFDEEARRLGVTAQEHFNACKGWNYFAFFTSSNISESLVQ